MECGWRRRRQRRRQCSSEFAFHAPCLLVILSTASQACIALEEGETPVGCVVVRDGTVIAAGANRTNATRNVSWG